MNIAENYEHNPRLGMYVHMDDDSIFVTIERGHVALHVDHLPMPDVYADLRSAMTVGHTIAIACEEVA